VDHAARRARLISRLQELGADAFLVTRRPNVRYLSGYSGSNGQLILTDGEAQFFTDGRYIEQSAREVPDATRHIYSGEFAPVFAKTCADLGVTRVAFEAADVSYRMYTRLQAATVELIPTAEEIERIRWVKEPEELEHLGAAQATADQAFEEVVPTLREGLTELEVALALETAMRRAGSHGLSFDTIVAFGPNAAEPHHEPTDRTLARGDVVKMDFGSVAAGFHSDMTRTVALGEPPSELREIYDTVRRAQQAGIEAVRGGAVGGHVDQVARDVIVEAGYGERYTHSLGHGVGLEVHEGPTLRAGGSDVLPVGAVVTVEPGIYVAGLGGVRIEDMVQVTEDGCRVIPRTTKDLLIR
jgi:Xaa-Pro aminopeptidase